MNATHTNSDLIQEVAERTGLSLTDSRNAVTATFDTIEKALLCNDRYVIRGFATFEMIKRKSRKGWDFDNKHHIKIDAQLIPIAKMSEILIKKVKRVLGEEK